MDATSKKPPPILKGLQEVLREIGWFVLIGLVGALALLWGFSEFTEAIFENEFTALDNNFLLWLHGFANPVLDLFFGFFTTFGSIAAVLIMTIILFGLLVWRKHFHSSWLLVVAVGGGVAINQMLKFYFERPRPQLWANNFQSATFSFPSGHATVSLCFLIMLSWLDLKFVKSALWRIGGVLVAGVCIIMVGLSRLYFGVHYPTDVIGGYLSGGLWMVALLGGVALYDRVRLSNH